MRSPRASAHPPITVKITSSNLNRRRFSACAGLSDLINIRRRRCGGVKHSI